MKLTSGTRVMNLEESIRGEDYVSNSYQYFVEVFWNGRFRVHIWNMTTEKGYVIAGDKKKTCDIDDLRAQIEQVIVDHAPNNKKIRDIIDKYWKADVSKSKGMRFWKRLGNLPD